MTDGAQPHRDVSPRRWPAWLPAHTDALTKKGFGSFTFVMLATMLLCFAAIAAFVVVALSHDRLSMLAVFVLIIVAARPVIDELGQRNFGARGPLIAWTWVAGISWWMTLAALFALGREIVSAHWRCGTGDFSAIIMTPVAVAVFGVAIAASLRARLGTHRPHFERYAAGGLIVCTTALAVITGVQTVRSFRRPSPESLLENAPLVAVLEPLPADEARAATQAIRVGAFTLERSCDTAVISCVLRLRGEPAMSGSSLRVTRLQVRHVDAARAYVIARDVTDDGVAPDARWVTAFDDQTGAPRSISATSLAGSTAAPRAWIFTALAGLLAFVVIAAGASRHRRAVDADLAAFEASDDGLSLSFFGSMPRARLHYRDAAHREPAMVIQGTMDQLRAAANGAVSARWMYGYAILALTSAPLVAFTIMMR